MKVKRIAIFLPLLAAAYMFAFAAPPVYLGAKAVDELNSASQKAGQNMTSYNSFDRYEKIYEFYKSKGTEFHGRANPRPHQKSASFKFEDGYAVTIHWKEEDIRRTAQSSTSAGLQASKSSLVFHG